MADYNRPLHIASIFIVLGASALGVAIPVAAKFFPALQIPVSIIAYGKSFGVGVILSTAFIHMLQPAFEELSSPCVGHVWSDGYPAFAALFAMCAILFMQLIEYFASNHLEHRFSSLENLPTQRSVDRSVAPTICDHQSIDRATIVDDYLSHAPCHNRSSATNRPCIHSQDNANEKLQNPFTTCPAHSRLNSQSDEVKDRKRWLNTAMLEFGILAHSVIIGITLGVSSQTEFAGLFIAICFHQFFEGFALGARIAEVNLICLRKATIMCAFFALTTPVGAAIGVGIASIYNPNSRTALITQGVFDAVSAGILIYVALVDLMATEMLFDDRFKAMKPITRAGCFFFVFAGAAVMAVIGIWT